MKKKYFIVLLFAALNLTACNEKNAEPKQDANATAPVKLGEGADFVVANDFSDAEWKNGILQKNGRTNQFYTIRKSGDPQILKVGDTLKFAKSGNAVILKLDLTDPNKEGIISVFVTIDKDIDPVGDGFPNKIFIQAK